MNKLDLKPKLHVLNVSLDPESADPNSNVAKRFIDYGSIVSSYTVLAFGSARSTFSLGPKVSIIVIEKRNKIFDFFRLFIALMKITKERRFSLITVPDAYFVGLITFFAAKANDLPIEIQIHGFEKLWGIRKLIARFVLPRANSLRVVSGSLKEELVSDFGVADEKITVVPIFSDTVLHPYIKKQNQEFTFLTVGRLVPIKDIEIQVRAFDIIQRKFNSRLWIVGDGKEEKRLKKIVGKLGLEQKISFFGKVNDVAPYYREADAFLLTSKREGWPRVIIEALSFNLPVIMTPVGQAGEMLEDGEHILLTSIGNSEALSHLMGRLIEDRELREKLIRNSRLAMGALPSKEEILKLYSRSWEKAVASI